MFMHPSLCMHLCDFKYSLPPLHTYTFSIPTITPINYTKLKGHWNIGVIIQNEKHAKEVQWIKPVVQHSFKTLLQRMVIRLLDQGTFAHCSSTFFSNKEVYNLLQWNVFNGSFNMFSYKIEIKEQCKIKGCMWFQLF